MKGLYESLPTGKSAAKIERELALRGNIKLGINQPVVEVEKEKK